MSDRLSAFERFVRVSGELMSSSEPDGHLSHPFDERNIHPALAAVSLRLFDDGHYSQATFEAFKFLDNEVKGLTTLTESGFKLMMAAFADTNPKIRLNDLISQSDLDEQSGYRFIFAGAMSAIRNPRGHEINSDPIGTCLDHLSFASVLLRRLDERIEPAKIA